MTGSEDPDLRKKAVAPGCHFFPKPLLISTLMAWVREYEGRFDLSEPLASDLFLPAKKEDLYVGPEDGRSGADAGIPHLFSSASQILWKISTGEPVPDIVLKIPFCS